MKNHVYPKPARILVVEDQIIVASDIEARLKTLGYSVVGTAANGMEAMSWVEKAKPDLILMDIILDGEWDGIETAQRIVESEDVPVVFLTSHTDQITLNRAKTVTPYGFIVKPFEEHALNSTVTMALYRHQSELRTRQMERWFSSTLQSIGDGVIAISPDHRIIFMNMVAEGLTGWKLENAVGLRSEEVFKLVNASTRAAVNNPAFQALREGLTMHLAPDTLLIRKDGQEISIEDSAAPIRDDHGAVVGAVVIFRDATERVKMEVTLQNLNRSLTQALTDSRGENGGLNKVTSDNASRREIEFMAHAISHDLRSPLAALKLYTDILGDTYHSSLGEEGSELIMGINQALARMEEMIGS
ncbi:MAG TPA: response regulator [Verrucomicrobiae bacterium]